MIERNFGLVGLLENRRVVLPLKAVECEFSVAAGMVEVRMTQVFRQENSKPLDCDYLFPLPADATVNFCEADFNGRIIRAKVKERGEAVRLAQEKKAEGRRVALVESERENLFTLTLSNLQPDDLVLVTLKYIQPLRHLADMPSVEIPFCPGIRYIPGNPLIRSNRGKGTLDDTDLVPDASRISPVRMEKEHPDASFIDIRGRIEGKLVEASTIVSPSHRILIGPDGDDWSIRLSDPGDVPDRDLVLRWQESKPQTLMARAWTQQVGEETYALLEIRAPKAAGPAEPMDYYYLLDQSGSMEGAKWQKAVLAVQTSVSKLINKDRVMLTLFNNGCRDFAEQPLPPARLLEEVSFQRLERSRPHGGTQLGGALTHVLELAGIHSPGRKKALMLITDAQVGNESAILKIMASAPDFPVHCFGIDQTLNDSLLLALVRQQQGTFHSLNPADDVVKVITDLAATMRHPVLQDLRLPDGWEPSLKSLPPLFSEQVFLVSARSRTRQPLKLTGRKGGKETEEIPIQARPAAGAMPRLHWCKNRIQTYMGTGMPKEATALSIETNLICPLTAFIAWDEAEKVAVASHALAQPTFESAEIFDQPMFKAAATPKRLMKTQLPRDEIRYCMASIEPASPEPRAYKRSLLGTLISALVGGILNRAGIAFPSEPVTEPRKLARIVAAYSRNPFRRLLPQPFPDVEVSHRALNALFNDICNFSQLRHLHAEWYQIMGWAFSDAQQILNRSTRVARLLNGLMKPAERCRNAYQELEAQLTKMERKLSGSRQDMTRVMRVIGDSRRTEVELRLRIEAEYHQPADARRVAGYIRNRDKIRNAIERFAQGPARSLPAESPSNPNAG